MYLFRGIFFGCNVGFVLVLFTLFDPLHHCIYSGSLFLQHKRDEDQTETGWQQHQQQQCWWKKKKKIRIQN